MKILIEIRENFRNILRNYEEVFSTLPNKSIWKTY